MTLNQIVNRIKTIALAHHQVRSFYFGKPTDFLTDKKTIYAGCFLQDTTGDVSPANKSFSFSFKMFLLDLVNVSENTKENELDVFSDMLEIAKDIIAEMDSNTYYDWIISGSNPVTLVFEAFEDMVGGATIDFSVRTMYEKDVCAVPSDELPGVQNNEDMKPVYDVVYTTSGSEGSTLSIPEMVGKKVLFATRENVPIYKVSNSPASSEFVWNNTVVQLGTPVNPETPERFLFLYRNY